MRLSWRTSIYLSLVCLVSFFSTAAYSQGPVVEPGEYTSSKVCGKCHKEIYNRWKVSLHAHSYDDPIFDVAYNIAYRKTAGRAKSICMPCHAPTTRITADFDAKFPITAEGITCDFCHTVKGVDLSRAAPFIKDVGLVKRGPLKEARGLKDAHQAAYSELHTKSELCAGCHEYRSKNSVPVMGTYTEWKEGPYAAKGEQCQSCHMPTVKGNVVASGNHERRVVNEHNLLGGHSLTQLKKAVQVKIINVRAEAARTEVMVDITNSGSGHMVPTGTPTRRLVLNVEITMEGGRVLRDKVVYEKVLVDMRGNELINESDIFTTDEVQITKDNRVKPGETRREVFTFYMTGKKIRKVEAWAVYSYRPYILERASMRIEMARDELSIR